jgi:hypothetical protein
MAGWDGTSLACHAPPTPTPDPAHITYPHDPHGRHSMLKDLTDEEEILRRAFQFFDKASIA